MSTDRELADAVAYTKTLEPPVLRLTLEANPTRAEGASQTSNPKPANNTAAAPSADLDALLANIKPQLPTPPPMPPRPTRTATPTPRPTPTWRDTTPRSSATRPASARSWAPATTSRATTGTCAPR